MFRIINMFIIRRSTVQAAYSISPCILSIIHIVSETRLLLRWMVGYCKLLVQNSSW